MTAGTQIRDELQSFATTVLERRGGLVDWPAGAPKARPSCRRKWPPPWNCPARSCR